MGDTKKSRKELEKAKEFLEKELGRFDKQISRHRDGQPDNPIIRGYLKEVNQRREIAAESLRQIKEALGRLDSHGTTEKESESKKTKKEPS